MQGLALDERILDMLKTDSPVAKAVGEAIGRGVEVIACEYSLNTRGTRGTSASLGQDPPGPERSRYDCARRARSSVLSTLP